MRSLAVAALVGANFASAFSISDYILAAGWTPAHAPAFQSSQDSASSGSEDATAPNTHPCGMIANTLAKESSKAVSADVAYDCLRSVPLHKEDGLVQLEGIMSMVQFQTTLAYLKDPPAGYFYPAVDIEAGLDTIQRNLENDGYTNEYDFQLAIYELITQAYDGHFSYIPDIVAAFEFARDQTIISLSPDGLSLPEFFLAGTLTDAVEYLQQDDTLMAIAKINGQDAETWVNQYAAENGGSQDPDANYNSVFPIVPTLGTTGPGLFALTRTYQGPYTTITFQDGTTRHINHVAAATIDLDGVKDGATFFEACCTLKGKEAAQREQESSNEARSAIKRAEKETPFKPVQGNQSFPALPGFPKPVVALKDQSVAGYFPEDIPELAVLSIPSFGPSDKTGVSFSDTVRTFLATAQAAGKKKLVVDLRGNPGGTVTLAYDTFIQIFPHIKPYGGTNFRATPLVDDIGSIVSEFYSNITSKTATMQDCQNDYDNALFNYRIVLDENDQPFTSWSDYFGPHEYHGDNFTSINRFDLDNFYSTICIPVSDYQNLVDITPQVFEPEDVLVVQDGTCASTCAVFSEFMKAQASVKQVVFGGRAQYGPMQGVGGVKGANVFDLTTIEAGLLEAFAQDATKEQHAELLQTYGSLRPGFAQALLRAGTNSEGSLARVNVRNNIRQGDESVTPLQFVYEAADCRIFYTPAMIQQQELVWSAAYAARWADGRCVRGSTGQPSSQSDYLGIGGPTSRNGTWPVGTNSTRPYPSWPNSTVSGTASSGWPSPPPNGTGIWSSTSAGATTTTWGSTRAPTATSSLPPSTSSPVPTNGARSVSALGSGVGAIGALMGMVMLL